MPANNDQFSIVQASGVGHKWTNAWWIPAGGANNPTVFGGAYVTRIVRSFIGSHDITLTGLSPRALLGAECYAFDAAAPTNTDAQVTVLTITPATKTVLIRVMTRLALGASTAKDIPAGAGSIVKVGFLWKTFIGEDVSGM